MYGTLSALKKIDRAFGSRMVDGLDCAAALASEVRRLKVSHIPFGLAYFNPSPAGLDDCEILINPDAEAFRGVIDSGLSLIRSPRLHKFFDDREKVLRAGELATFVFVHELGHAEALSGETKQADGDTVEAFFRYTQTVASSQASLPLGGMTSIVQNKWKNNINGYRDDLNSRGIGEKEFMAQLQANSAAYAQLPIEAAADAFGMGVISDLY